jgi:serine/threonine protein phosphatase PrpC
LVSPEPEFIEVPRKEVDFILLACDGVWDVRSTEEAVAEIHERVYNKKFHESRPNDEDFR